MIIISYTVACVDEDSAQRIHLLFPETQTMLKEPGVQNVSIMWSNEEDEDES